MHMEALFLAAEGESPNPLIPAIYDIVWSIIPFALVLFLFWRIVLPRLQKTLDERSLAIEGGIAEAQSHRTRPKRRWTSTTSFSKKPVKKPQRSEIRLVPRDLKSWLR